MAYSSTFISVAKKINGLIQQLLMKIDKQCKQLTNMCKGKYTKKLAEIRKRHVRSLNINSTSVETVDDKEWVVQSETMRDEMYTVKRLKDACSCELSCVECKACIHIYSCTCADNATFFNMCKHIHLVCSKCTIIHSVEQDEDEAELGDNLFIAENASGRDNIYRTVVADAIIDQLSRPTSRPDEMRHTARQVCANVALLIESIQDTQQLSIIIDCLKSIEPRIDAAVACNNLASNFPQTMVSQK
jgi:hypothetical protein